MKLAAIYLEDSIFHIFQLINSQGHQLPNFLIFHRIQTKLSPIIISHHIYLIQLGLLIYTMRKHMLLTQSYIFNFLNISMQPNHIIGQLGSHILRFNFNIIKFIYLIF